MVGHFDNAGLNSPLTYTLNLRPFQARLFVLLVALLTTLALSVLFSESFRTVEERLGALGWKLGDDNTLEQRVSIIAIDEKSIEQIGPWPWPRQTMARLSAALNEAGTQLQIYDIVYPEQNSGDAELLRALRSGNSVMAQVPILDSSQAIRTGVLTHPVGGISCNNSNSVMSATTNYLASNAYFAQITKGHITPNVATDGSIRDVPAVICVDNKAYPALAISALLQATNTNDWSVSIDEDTGIFGPAANLTLDAYPGITVPLDSEGNMRISYEQPPEYFQVISAVEVMNGQIDRELLNNTWALVGTTAFGLGDIVPTPYSGTTPGVELQARLLTAILDNNTPYTPRTALAIFVLFGVFASLVLLLLANGKERFSSAGLPVSGLLLPVLALALHMQLLSSSNIWLGWLGPALFSFLGAVFLILLEHGRVRLERSRVFDNLSSYLPSEIAEEIAFNLPSSSVNARRMNVTLLSADLRNFSAYGEARPPEESAALLHYFFLQATAIIEQFHGRIHEFKGDGLLAVWDGNGSESATASLNAALSMHKIIKEFLPQNPPAALEPLDLGIGIEQGSALIGSIGPAHRRSHTLLGDTVTITMRIQEMTAELAQPVLVGENAARHFGDKKLESQGSYLLNGLKIPHVLFAPVAPFNSAVQPMKNEEPFFKLVHGGRQ